MAADYNAKLIAELYSISLNNKDKATTISDEMLEIGDPIFPRQIYEAYKKFKDTSISHYFVLDLCRFDIDDSKEIIKEIANITDSPADLSMMVSYLAKIEYYDPIISDKIMAIFEESLAAKTISNWDIDSYVAYFMPIKPDVLLEKLLACFFDSDIENDSRKAALKFLLKTDTKKYLTIFYDNYDSIKNTKTEIILVNEIKSRDGGIIPSFHQKILESGSATAKEILQQYLDQKNKHKVEKK